MAGVTLDREALERLEEELSHPRVMRVTTKQMDDAQLPLAFRDYCAHILIPLNRCRRENYYLPWKCVQERHAYEACEYEELMRRKKWYLIEKEKRRLDKEEKGK